MLLVPMLGLTHRFARVAQSFPEDLCIAQPHILSKSAMVGLSTGKAPPPPGILHVRNVVVLPVRDDAGAQFNARSLVGHVQCPMEVPSMAGLPILVRVNRALRRIKAN